MVSADYSQIELRIARAPHRRRELLDAFRRGEDIHTAHAAAVFKSPVETVDAEPERLAKIANFGSSTARASTGSRAGSASR